MIRLSSWTFPLRHKSDTPTTLQNFIAYIHIQFHLPLQAIQTDNGREFINNLSTNFFQEKGIVLRLSCPYTSPQNGKAKCALRTINDVILTLLLQAHIPPSYWVEALSTATYIINHYPCQPIQFDTHYERLFDKSPHYTHLRVFGYLCFPNLSATAPHKLTPRSIACIFLNCPSNHKGYWCFDPTSQRVFTSRHVTFDKKIFPFTANNSNPPSTKSLDFLLDFSSTHMSSTIVSPGAILLWQQILPSTTLPQHHFLPVVVLLRQPIQLSHQPHPTTSLSCLLTPPTVALPQQAITPAAPL